MDFPHGKANRCVRPSHGRNGDTESNKWFQEKRHGRQKVFPTRMPPNRQPAENGKHSTLARPAPACAAEVYSSNIVGYEKVGLSANAYYLSGVQFTKVGGEAATLNDLFPATDIPYGTEVLTLNDQGQYDSYTYLEEAYDAVLDDFVPGWGDVGEEIVTDGIEPGVGIWVKAPEGCDLSQVGEVVSSDSVTIDVPAGSYTMIANPFPTGFNPNKVEWSTNLPFETEILTLNDQGQYDSYTYLEEAYDAALDDFVSGWGDVGEEIVIDDIATNGQGLWIKAPEAITITISKTAAE